MSPALDYDRIAHLYDAFVRTEADVPFWLEECSGVPGPVLHGRVGDRFVVTLINALRQQGKTRGVAAICIGGGEGTALAVEIL